MQNIRLIALDLDGTLFQPNETVSAPDREALAEAQRRGIELVVSTGRQKTIVPKWVFPELSIRYMLAANGAVADDMRTGETLFARYMDNMLASQVAQALIDIECLFIGFGPDTVYGDTRLRKLLERPDVPFWYPEFVKSWTWVEDLPATLARGDIRVLKFTADFFREADGTPHCRKEAVAALECIEGLNAVCGGGDNLEVTAGDVDKGTGLRALCAHLGIAPEACMACGDSGNDIALLRAAGVGVAMANATPDVLEAADYVTGRNTENGVAQAVRRFALVDYSSEDA